MTLLHEMLAFCERTGTPHSLLGHRTVGDSTLVNEMRRGRNVTVRNASRIRAMMAKHPEGWQAPKRKDPAPKKPPVADLKNRWEVQADIRKGSERLREATQAMAPASIVRAPLTFEEKLALVVSGKAKLVSAAKPQASYSYSLVGGSLD